MSNVADTSATPASWREVGAASGAMARECTIGAMRVLRRAFVATSLAWAAAIPLATWIAGRSHVSAPAAGLAVLVYAVGAVVCHQLPARSFQLWAAQMPVCARCTGIYFGAATAALASVWLTTGASPLPDTPFAHPRLVLLAAAVPTAATLVFEWTTGLTPSNTVRALAGLPLGAAVAWVIARQISKVN